MGGESRERPSQRVVGRLREVRRYSRHSALTAAAAGLALAPASIEASFLGAAFAVAALAVLRAPRLALVAGAIVLSAALVGHARLQSIDRSGLRVRSGDRVRVTAPRRPKASRLPPHPLAPRPLPPGERRPPPRRRSRACARASRGCRG